MINFKKRMQSSLKIAKMTFNKNFIYVQCRFHNERLKNPNVNKLS
jgi:hypothetical protein